VTWGLRQGKDDRGLDLEKVVVNTMQKATMTHTKLKALLLKMWH
jgi:hypothetical protein